MKSFLAHSRSTTRYGLGILAVFCVFASATLLSSARSPSPSIRVVNNSGWEIRHLFLSPVSQDNWGPDQLNNGVISPGGEFTISNVSCSEGSSIKVISEDADGCFLSQIVACSEGAVWTITSNATPNCGSE